MRCKAARRIALLPFFAALLFVPLPRSSSPLRADADVAASREFRAPGGCDLSAQQDASTSLTFFGDSLGQYVARPEYGHPAGWPAFLETAEPGSGPWRLQNLAVGGWTTGDVYAYLLRCAGDERFLTATRYVLEIGTNDYLRNAPLAAFMPWRIPSIRRQALENRRSLIRLLQKVLAKRGLDPERRLLWMGNLPVVAAGPVSGSPDDGCFVGALNRCDLEASLRGQAGADAGPGYGEQAWNIWQHLTGGDTPEILTLYGGTDAEVRDYVGWINSTARDKSGLTLVSELLYEEQPALETLAQKEGVEFLKLYDLYVNENDCRFGACYVGLAELYRDRLHINARGYALWARRLAPRLRDFRGRTADAPPSAPDSGFADEELPHCPDADGYLKKHCRELTVQLQPTPQDWAKLAIILHKIRSNPQ